MTKVRAPRLVTVAIMTTITIIFWVFFGVYNVLVSKPPVDVPPEILEPLDPTLDTEALGQIEQRVFFEEDEIEKFAAQTTPAQISTLTPTPTEVPIEESESQATESATATPSAETE